MLTGRDTSGPYTILYALHKRHVGREYPNHMMLTHSVKNVL